MPANAERLPLGKTRIAHTYSINHDGHRAAVPGKDQERLLRVGTGGYAIGRARVYYTSYPGVDVLAAVLTGLRRL